MECSTPECGRTFRPLSSRMFLVSGTKGSTKSIASFGAPDVRVRTTDPAGTQSSIGHDCTEPGRSTSSIGPGLIAGVRLHHERLSATAHPTIAAST